MLIKSPSTAQKRQPSGDERPAFQAFQYEFARYLRDPALRARPAHVSARGAEIYSRLLYGNLRSFLDRCFPLSHAILGEARWHTLSRCFYRDYPLHSPVFRDMLHDFVDFLNDRQMEAGLPLWLPELAHYEWVEMVVALAPTSDTIADDEGDLGNLLDACPVTSPTLRLLSYGWPVHRISADWQPESPEPSHLLVHRDGNGRVRMHESNLITLRLLALFDGKTSGRDTLHALAAEIGYQPVSQLIGFGAEVMNEMRQLGVLRAR